MNKWLKKILIRKNVVIDTGFKRIEDKKLVIPTRNIFIRTGEHEDPEEIVLVSEKVIESDVIDLTNIRNGEELFESLKTDGVYKVNKELSSENYIIGILRKVESDGTLSIVYSENGKLGLWKINKDGLITNSNVTVDEPTDENDIANKKYVDKKTQTNKDEIDTNMKHLERLAELDTDSIKTVSDSLIGFKDTTARLDKKDSDQDDEIAKKANATDVVDNAKLIAENIAKITTETNNRVTDTQNIDSVKVKDEQGVQQSLGAMKPDGALATKHLALQESLDNKANIDITTNVNVGVNNAGKIFQVANDGTLKMVDMPTGGGGGITDVTALSGIALYNAIDKPGLYKIKQNQKEIVILVNFIDNTTSKYGTFIESNFLKTIIIQKNGVATIGRIIVQDPKYLLEIANKGYVDLVGKGD